MEGSPSRDWPSRSGGEGWAACTALGEGEARGRGKSTGGEGEDERDGELRITSLVTFRLVILAGSIS